MDQNKIGSLTLFAEKKHKEGIIYHMIGANIIKARNKLGITQEQLATKLGVSRVSVGNIESGKQRLPVHLIYLICEKLKINIADLFTGTSFGAIGADTNLKA